MESSIRAVLLGTLGLRTGTGLTGALLVYHLAEMPEHGGEAVGAMAMGLLTALFLVAELAFSPPFGVAVDRHGAYRILQLGPLFGLGAAVLTAFTAELPLPGSTALAVPLLVGSIPAVALGRLLAGASTAASVPSILGFLAHATSGDEGLRGRSAARFQVVTIVGLGAGFVMAGPAWAALGPWAFVPNAAVYLVSWLVYWRGVAAGVRGVFGSGPDTDRLAATGTGTPDLAAPRASEWRRYRELLSRPLVWLIAPTWLALNATLGLYSSQALFQLVRERDPAFPDQLLVGGLSPPTVTLGALLAGLALFAGLWFWGARFTDLRRTSMIGGGLGGGALLVACILALNHGAGLSELVRSLLVLGMLLGVFLLAGAMPAALGLLADISEAFPNDRGAIMGLYSVLLGVGQVVGALLGGLVAAAWALDGVLVATLLVMAVALIPLARLRRFELRYQASPAAAPGLTAAAVDHRRTGHRHDPG